MKKQINKSNNIGSIRLFFTLIAETFRHMPIYYSVQQLVAVVHGISQGVITWMTQRFFEDVTNATMGSNTNLINSALLLGAVAIGAQLLNGYHNYSHLIIFKRSYKIRTMKIIRKAALINPIEYEKPSMLDNIDKAREGMNNSVFYQMIFMTIFTYYLPYFMFMGFYLYNISPILAFGIALVFLPTLLTQIIRTRIYRDLEKEIAPYRRKYEYYENSICGREHFKETRILGAFAFLRNTYLDMIYILNKKQWKADKKSGLIELGMKMLTLCGYFGILAMLVYLLVSNEITAGAFAAVFASLDKVFGIMEEIICQHIGGMTKDLGSVENYMNFIELPERKGTIDEINRFSDIHISDASFAYPESKVDSISDVNLDIKSGSIIAIVGANGAGKSTLMRLISGIYLPTKGVIKFGETDISNVKPTALFESISGVFQKYQKYQMSLNDNILISDHSKEFSQSNIENASKQSGIKIDKKTYPDGYETMLSREFDGVDLSGGQWQRVAIARGYYKEHSMIILDEPTAAIDPIEESRIYEQFAIISRGKTAFIVTHRLGSAKIADRIIVMDKGKVSEDGTHDELMNQNGDYAEMFRAQAKWYV